MSTQKVPVIGITMGDINGVGPELLLQIFSDHRITKFMTPVVYGSGRVFSFYKRLLQLNQFNYQMVASAQEAHVGKVNVINCWSEEVEITPGKATETSGKCAFNALEKATADWKEGKIDALVTAPINKATIQSDAFSFPGHTEYLTSVAGAKDSLMFLVSDQLRVGVATGHIPVEKIKESLNRDLIVRKATLMSNSLKKDFGIQRPKIAILGLNPHAGENGLLGSEEKDMIIPAIEVLKENNILAYGPFPSDGFFGKALYHSYDGILAMYHDQGLIPFKALAFESGVNFTAGLPFVRTSPDHGTAYDLAGKNTADATSFRTAILLALDIVKQHRLV